MRPLGAEGVGMVENKGVIASGGSHVAGVAVASGEKSKAEVRESGVIQPGAAAGQSPQEIRDLLTRLIEELGRSDLPERSDLIEAAQDAQEELGSAEPRLGKLRLFARTLRSAVADVASLGTLAITIEQAVHGL